MATAVQDQTLQLPSLPPAPGPRRRTAAVVVAGIVGGLAVTGLSVTALGSDSRTVRSAPLTAVPSTTIAAPATTVIPATTLAPEPPAALPPTTTAPPATTAAPERLTSESRLRLDGLGPVRIGMTLKEASAAAGVSIRLQPNRSGGLDCSYARAETGPEVGFMVVGDRIVRIDVGHKGANPVRTLSGIGTGSTEAEVMRTYPGQIRVERHHYVEGARVLVYVPNDPAFRTYSMIFESIEGRVTSFRSGLADPVSWIEGCS